MAIGLGLAWAVIVALVLGERRTPARLPYTARVGAGDGDTPPRWRAVVPAPAPEGRLLSLRWAPGCDARLAGLPIPTPTAGSAGPRLPQRPWRRGRCRWPWSRSCGRLSPPACRRRARRVPRAAITDQLPDVVDLLALTTAAGLPIAAALCAIRRRPGGPARRRPRTGGRPRRAGGAPATALSLVVDDGGTSTRPLVDALAAHDRYGTPLRRRSSGWRSRVACGGVVRARRRRAGCR